MNPINWYPRHSNNQVLDEGFRRAFDFIYQLRDKLNNVSSQPAPLSLQQIQQNLQLGGLVPINVTGLPGTNNSVPPPPVIEATHANRLAFNLANKSPLGALLYETDLGVLLLNMNQSNSLTWTPIINYPLVGLRSNRQNNVNPFFLPNGAPYYEIDTDLVYVAETITIVGCTVSGTTITYAGNNNGTGPFNNNWVQYPIGIANQGSNFQVVSVAANKLVLTLATAPPASNNSFDIYIPAGEWQYQAGVWVGDYTSRPPTANLTALDEGVIWNSFDLGLFSQLIQTPAGPQWVYTGGIASGSLSTMLAMNPSNYEHGILFQEVDYGHTHLWNGNAWVFAPGDTGSGFVVFGSNAAPHGPATTAPSTVNGWYPCDGGSYNVCIGNGNTVGFNTQNINGKVAALFGGGFNQNFTPGAQPTWSNNANTGVESSDILVVTTAGTNNVANAGHTHQYATNNANAPLNVPSELNGGLPDHFKMSAWLRA